VETRISPKNLQYSSDSFKFKKTPQNLDRIHKEVLEASQIENVVKVLRKKSEDQYRY
jgi:hypothetical protein